MKLLKVSKILHVVVLLCCFLPAIVPSCEEYPSRRQLEEQAKAKQDSITEVAKADSLKLNATDTTIVESKNDTAITTAIVDTTLAKPNVDADKPKEKKEEISVGQKMMIYLLFPDTENLSFIGYIVFNFIDACPTIFFLLLFWATLARFRTGNHKFVFMLSLMGQIALMIFIQQNFKHVVWGIWVVCAISLLNAILNWWIYFKAKKNKLTNVWGDL